MGKKKFVEEHRIERDDTSMPNGEGVRAFLDEIDPDAVCEKCGGLPYDMVFSHNGVQYKFCLYKIQKEGKVLAETDYEKLHEYTKKDGVMMSLREKKARS
jgi:hypothetical protein